MSGSWPLTPLGDVLIERTEIPDSLDLEQGRVRIISKISFANGKIEFRDDGDTKTNMILIRPGDLVVSGINAAKGAIAIYDRKEKAPAAATIHYGAYAVREHRADVQFLWWLLRSHAFRDLLNDHVPGGIKTELKAKQLLSVPVPLPPVQDQRWIVVRIERLAAKIEAAQAARHLCDLETRSVLGAALNWIGGLASDGARLGNYLEGKPRNGWSARCDNALDGVPVLGLSSVTGFLYRESEYKRTSLTTDPSAHYWLAPGDLLVTRSNTPELVGHAAIYTGSPMPCIYPDLMMRIPVDPEKATTKFIWYWLQTPIAREFISSNAKGTSPTMKKISQDVLMNLPAPRAVSLAMQHRIVAYLDGLQARIEPLKALQAQTRAELDALLPSILDRAFKGEL